MQKKQFIAAALASGLAATMALATIAPADAQSMRFNSSQRDRVVSQYCDRNPRDSDCRDYHRGHWSSNDYNPFYTRHRTNLDTVARGLFGFAFGTIVNGIANANGGGGSTGNHGTACAARFHSYNARTDMYVGNDGKHHACQL